MSLMQLLFIDASIIVRSVATQQRLVWCSWFWLNFGGIPVIFSAYGWSLVGSGDW